MTCKRYQLNLCVSNIKHKPWWWHGCSFYCFESLELLLDFIKKRIPFTKKEEERIRKQDEIKGEGKLANNSWYEIVKGEPMTAYTSF